MDPVVYRALDPTLDAHLETMRVTDERFGSTLAAFLTAVDPDRPRRARLSGFPGAPKIVTSIEHRADWPVPVGWRMERRSTTVIVPDRRTPQGRAAFKMMRTVLRTPGTPNLPGMPHNVEHTLDNGRVMVSSPAVDRYDGRWYIAWRVPETALADVDTTVWERVPLSVYYAAREAQEAAA